MNTDIDLRNLFILDLANNHQGSVAHGCEVIRQHGDVVRNNNIRATLKFQFRQLDTFIHPAHREQSDNKHVSRFLGTRLSKDDFGTMAEEVRRNGMLTMATPFDEGSVDMLLDLDMQIIKIASCSAADWPLLEYVADTGRPVVISTGGLTLKQIDDLNSFFEHRRVQFAMMHCVAVYPTPSDMMELNEIGILKARYRNVPIGFSTHEDPNAVAPVYVAVAKGAELLERHVGVETDEIKLNKYSSTPSQADAWMKAYHEARTLCGHTTRQEPSAVERESLDSLARGVYAAEDIAEGEEVKRTDVFFAMPVEPGQITSGQWIAGMKTKKLLAKNQSLHPEDVEIPPSKHKGVLYETIHAIKGMLNEARIAMAPDFGIEFSHHYGLDRFHEVGCVIIDVINREYCKKLIVQLPGQRHPSHYHKKKEETFQVLYGMLNVEIEGKKRTLYPGDTLLVHQGVWHEFSSETGVIFEEISTTHFNNDSFYEDKEINRIDRSERKTRVSHWGRYQL